MDITIHLRAKASYKGRVKSMRLLKLKILVLLTVLFSPLVRSQNPQTFSMSAPPPSAATNVSVNVVGGSLSTYYYWVVANYPIGKVIVSTPTPAFRGPTTFGASNYVNIGWNAQTGATTYDVLRTTTQALPSGTTNSAVATGLTATSFKDTVVSPSSYTLSPLASAFNGAMSIDNTNSSIPMMVWTLPEVNNFPVKTITFSDGTTQITAGGGGGAITLSSGAGAPVGSCTAPTGTGMALYNDTTNHNLWRCSNTNTWRLILDTSGTGTFFLSGNQGTDPCGTVASGQDCLFFNSAVSNHLFRKDDTQTLFDVEATGGGGGFNAPVAFASKPTCSSTAFYQLFTDSILAQVCNGSSTQSWYYGTNLVTPPTAASTWTAIGTSTKTDSGGIVNFTGVGTGTASVISMVKAIPGATFDIKVAIKFRLNANATTQGCGLIVTDGATTGSKLILSDNLKSNTNNEKEEILFANDNALTGATDLLTRDVMFRGEDLFFRRVVQDSTNLTFYNSTDGINWVQLFQEAKATHLVVADYGIACWLTDALPFQASFISDLH